MSLPTDTILLVEDNEDDVFIFTRAYKQTKLPNPVHVARDGQEALDYLLAQGEFSDRSKFPQPFLVLLDLKLPLKPGLEVLEVIRSRPELKNICVIILTSSAEARDILRAHELGANAFLVKPPSAKTLGAAVAAACGHAAASDRVFPRVEGDMFGVALPSGARRSSPAAE